MSKYPKLGRYRFDDATEALVDAIVELEYREWMIWFRNGDYEEVEQFLWARSVQHFADGFHVGALFSRAAANLILLGRRMIEWGESNRK